MSRLFLEGSILSAGNISKGLARRLTRVAAGVWPIMIMASCACPSHRGASHASDSDHPPSDGPIPDGAACAAVGCFPGSRLPGPPDPLACQDTFTGGLWGIGQHPRGLVAAR